LNLFVRAILEQDMPSHLMNSTRRMPEQDKPSPLPPKLNSFVPATPEPDKPSQQMNSTCRRQEPDTP
jgi:hypothetical protein